MKKSKKRQQLIILISIILIAIIIGIVVSVNVTKINITNGKYNTANNNSASSNLLPEYIKAGITLGGVTGTLEDLDTSDATATAADIAWGKTAYVKGEKITGTYRNLTLKDLEIGDYVAYTPGSETASSYSLTAAESGYTSDQTISKNSLNWRVLSINDDGTVDLISAAPTNSPIYFRGATGYNNGVYLLNDIADEFYSNDSLGVTARSLTIEDIEAGMTDAGLEYVHSYNNGYKTVGETATYTSASYRYYPNLYAQENGSGIDTDTIKEDGINQSDSYYSEPTTETYTQASSSLTVTQTYYFRSMSSSYYKNSTFYNLIHTGYTYWLASRFVNAYGSYYTNFGLRYVNYGDLNGYYLFNSGNSTGSSNFRLRAVVSLESNIKLSTGDGSSGAPYQIAN